KPAALGQQLRTGGAMDGSVYPAASKQRWVGCIDDGVHVECGDVGLDDLDRVGHKLHSLMAAFPRHRLPAWPVCTRAPRASEEAIQRVTAHPTSAAKAAKNSSS